MSDQTEENELDARIDKYAEAYWDRPNHPNAPGHRVAWKRVIAVADDEINQELEEALVRAQELEAENAKLKDIFSRARTLLSKINTDATPPAIAAQEPDQSTQEPS